jgi:hypothetical protein
MVRAPQGNEQNVMTGAGRPAVSHYACNGQRMIASQFTTGYFSQL